jgi:hypothetical protein
MIIVSSLWINVLQIIDRNSLLIQRGELKALRKFLILLIWKTIQQLISVKLYLIKYKKKKCMIHYFQINLKLLSLIKLYKKQLIDQI